MSEENSIPDLDVLLPFIRATTPGIMAQEIVNVQSFIRPSSMEVGFTDGLEHPYWVDLPNSVGAIFNIDAFDEKHKEQTDWCLETFADEDWMASSFKFYFRNMKDRDWFVMRWS